MTNVDEIVRLMKNAGIARNKVDSLRPDQSLEEQGFDSYDRMSLLTELEEHFSVDLPNPIASQLKTLDDIVRHFDSDRECPTETPNLKYENMPTDSFTGAWKLISSEMRTSGGDVQYPLGKDCTGRLVIDDQGNFSAQLMRQDRPKFASDDVVRGTDEEIRSAYQGYVSFWAKFEIDPVKQEMTYVVEGSLFPNWLGHQNLRYYQFDDNRLTLKTPCFLMAGQEITGVLIWERIE